jgi:hypothetical protein
MASKNDPEDFTSSNMLKRKDSQLPENLTHGNTGE